jgi:hypothetical protein
MNFKVLAEKPIESDWICPTCWCWPTQARVYLIDNRYFDLKDGDEVEPANNIARIVCLNCKQELY